MPSPPLWILSFDVPSRVAEAFGEAFSEESAAISVLAPPRQETARIEIIYAFEPERAEINTRLAVLAAALGPLPSPVFTLIPAPPLDWLKKVAGDFPPLRIGRWVMHGAMHRAAVSNRLFALQIDATNAFGTGEHPTTRCCLLMLDHWLRGGFRPSHMADIGCGSGILAMACAQGAKHTLHACGVDMDSDSVAIARTNARQNGLLTKIRLTRGRGYAPPLIRAGSPYDLIMANIFARPLAQLAAALKANLKPKGRAILSGLLTSQANAVIAAHRAQGLKLIAHKKDGEWSVLGFTQ